ncbi:AAA family ATPase [Acidocella aminolytica]|uniref:Recombination factor protein RarA/AAA ATPase n=1 Tax=Acidocella aminolytica 101 = DSM 11237 TaxID=1120923 RepID=A0A0D6PMJ7_9PROT|nr:AAA family ATPase [Acidocella aminolytica]GAN82039.1 recombination factor protein RarA/AAA ATPase [Acidocella aminolytica 101 = DSM 11237]SHE30249.1 ATPase family associated with various cellular activities (AAA) [Acidocella aminolytica 101 = DSM 11237]
MFSDEEPSVDDTILQDLKFVGADDHRTNARSSYPIVSHDVLPALALGFRHKLTQAGVDRLLSALNQCCRYYAESIALPVTIFGTGGGEGSAPGEPRVVHEEIFLNPVGHDDWVKLIDGLNSYHRRGETCWLFARTLANLPSHTPEMRLSRAGRAGQESTQDSTVLIDARLIRLGALRLAITSHASTVAIAACVEMIALLVEIQADQELLHHYDRRVHNLFEATSTRLRRLAGPPLCNWSEENQIDFASAPPFWMNASVTWLEEIVHARNSGFLPGDEFVLAAQKLFSELAPPSGEELSAATRRRHGGGMRTGRYGEKRRDGKRGEASGQLQDEAENSRPRGNGSGSPPGALGENSSSKQERHSGQEEEGSPGKEEPSGTEKAGNAGKAEEASSLEDVFGRGTGAITGTSDAARSQNTADDTINPGLKALQDEIYGQRGVLRQSPSLQPMRFLDLSPHADEAKRKYAEQFRALEHPMPLTELPQYKELVRDLGSLREAMPNFGAILDALQGDFAFALRSEGPAVLRLRPMLLVGPPAIGKTRFARELTKALGAESSYISVAGDADNRRFAGTAHGFSTAHPSWPVERMVRLGWANPVLIVDEIEKAGGSKSNGTLTDTILGLLEPESARQFTDPFLGGPIDVSAISWIFLANSRHGLSEPLLSRLELFQIAPPEPAAFNVIVRAILDDIAKSRSIAPDQIPALPELFLAELKAAYVQRRDLRRVRITLEKALGILARYDNEHLGETLH